MNQLSIVDKKHPPLQMLVPVQNEKGTAFGRPEFRRACRGNDDMAVVLNYFNFEASSEAAKSKIDPTKVQFVQIRRTLDEIYQGINKCVSIKTLIAYIKKLNGYGFIGPHSYHHLYDVYFHAIQEAVTNPPPEEKKKPRGRHVVKSTIPPVKSTISTISPSQEVNLPLELANCKLELANQQAQIVNLQFQIVELQSQIVNLQSLQSNAPAPQADAEGKKSPLDYIDYIDSSSSSSDGEKPERKEEEEERKVSSQKTPTPKQEPPVRIEPQKQEPSKQEWGPKALIELVYSFQGMIPTPEQIQQDLPQAQNLLRQTRRDGQGQTGPFTQQEILLILEDCLGKECQGGWYKQGLLDVKGLAKGIAIKTYTKLKNQKQHAEKRESPAPPRQAPPTDKELAYSMKGV